MYPSLVDLSGHYYRCCHLDIRLARERDIYQDSYYVVIIMKQIEGKLIQVMDRHVGCTCSGNTVRTMKWTPGQRSDFGS